MSDRIHPAAIDATGYVGDGSRALHDDGTWKIPAGGGDLFYVDIRDHGADPAAANNTTAIQAAADAAAGGVLVVPKGTWITDPISVAGNTTVHLYGKLKLRAQDASTLPAPWGVLYAYGTSGAHLSNVHVIGFGGQVDANRANLTGTISLDSECINFKYVDHGSIIGVEVFNAPDSGIDLDYCTDITVRGNYAHDCGGWGIHMSNGTVDSLVDGNTVTGCGAANSRGGINQHAPDGLAAADKANRNRFFGNRAVSNYQNYSISGQYALFDSSNVSQTGTTADSFTANLTTLKAIQSDGTSGELVYKPNPRPELFDPSGGTTIDTEARAALADIKALLVSMAVATDGDAVPPATNPVTSGLVLQLSPEGLSGFTDGAQIDTWTDQSTVGNNGTQATAASRPVVRAATLNGLAVAEFDGSNDYLQLPDSTIPIGNGAYSIFAVVKWDALPANGNGTIVAAGSVRTAKTQNILRAKASGVLNNAWYSSNLDSAASTIPLGSWHLVGAFYGGTGRTIRANGGQVGSDSVTGKNTASSFHAVGANYDAFDAGYFGFLDGMLAEVLVYNRQLTTTETTDVEDYLTSKYAL